MLEWLFENWYMIIVAIAVLVGLGFATYRFIKLPKGEKLKKVKQMLLLWVTLAEKEYGSGTGEIKLRWVFDKFTAKYKFISFFISFERFSKWVDDALDKMRELLEKNENVNKLVSNVVNN